MKKILSLSLVLILMICTVPFVVSADETEIYKSVSVEYSDNRGKTEKLDVMVKNQNVYVEANELALRFGFICAVSDGFINIKNITNINLPSTSTVIFNSNNTQVKKLILSKFIDTYEAPFASVINDKGTWIPFEYALLMLNSGLLIVNNCILIDIPQKTIIDCFNDVLVNDSEFTFDWNKDIGYTDVDETVSVMSNHFVNVFSGLLDFDGYSWAELFQALVFDSSSYDSKYGKNLALFLCTEADEELNATIEQMDFVDEMLDGNLGRALNIQSKSINGSVENLYNQCNNLLTEIKSGNSSSLSMYNRTYKEFEKALNKQTNVVF